VGWVEVCQSLVPSVARARKIEITTERKMILDEGHDLEVRCGLRRGTGYCTCPGCSASWFLDDSQSRWMQLRAREKMMLM